MRSLLAEPIPARALDQAAFSRSGQAWGCPPVSLPVVRDQRRTAGVTGKRKPRDGRRDGMDNQEEKEMEGRYCMIRNEGGFKITHIEKE